MHSSKRSKFWRLYRRVNKKCTRVAGSWPCRLVFLTLIVFAALSVFYTTMYLGVLKSAGDFAKNYSDKTDAIGFLFAHIPFVGSSIVFGIHLTYLVLVGQHAIANKPVGYNLPILSCCLLIMLCTAYILPACLLFYLVQIEHVTQLPSKIATVTVCVKATSQTLFAGVYALWALHAWVEKHHIASAAKKERISLLDSTFWFYVDPVLCLVLLVSLLDFGVHYAYFPKSPTLLEWTLWNSLSVKELAALTTILTFVFSRNLLRAQQRQSSLYFLDTMSRAVRIENCLPPDCSPAPRPIVDSSPLRVLEFYGDDISATHRILTQLGLNANDADLVQVQPMSNYQSDPILRFGSIKTIESVDDIRTQERPTAVVINFVGELVGDTAAIASLCKNLPVGAVVIARGPAPTSLYSIAGRNVARGNLFSIRSPKLHRWDLSWLARFLDRFEAGELQTVNPSKPRSSKRSVIGSPTLVLQRRIKLSQPIVHAVSEFIGLAFQSESTSREVWKHLRYALNHAEEFGLLGEHNVDELVYVYQKHDITLFAQQSWWRNVFNAMLQSCRVLLSKQSSAASLQQPESDLWPNLAEEFETPQTNEPAVATPRGIASQSLLDDVKVPPVESVQATDNTSLLHTLSETTPTATVTPALHAPPPLPKDATNLKPVEPAPHPAVDSMGDVHAAVDQEVQAPQLNGRVKRARRGRPK